jgi:hypothetical protein
MTLIWQGTFRAFGKLVFRSFALSRKEASGVKNWQKTANSKRKTRTLMRSAFSNLRKEALGVKKFVKISQFKRL